MEIKDPIKDPIAYGMMRDAVQELTCAKHGRNWEMVDDVIRMIGTTLLRYEMEPGPEIEETQETGTGEWLRKCHYHCPYNNVKHKEKGATRNCPGCGLTPSWINTTLP